LVELIKNTATAYLWKAKTVPKYQQNDAHHDCYKYCKITRSDYLLCCLIDSGQITGIFLDGNDNGAESIWAVQFSINDGTNAGRVSYVTGLTHLMELLFMDVVVS
jgi:hypothetical protein